MLSPSSHTSIDYANSLGRYVQATAVHRALAKPILASGHMTGQVSG
jgi:hypothetical protein